MKTFDAFHTQTGDRLFSLKSESFETVASDFIKENGGKLFKRGDYIPGFRAHDKYQLAKNTILFVDRGTKEEKSIDLDEL